MKKLFILTLPLVVIAGVKFLFSEASPETSIGLIPTHSQVLPNDALTLNEVNEGYQDITPLTVPSTTPVNTTSDNSYESFSNELVRLELPGLAEEEESIFYDEESEKLVIKDAETGEVIYETSLSQELLAKNFSGQFKTNEELALEINSFSQQSDINNEENNTFTLFPNEDKPEVLILNDNGDEKIIHIEDL